MNRLARLITIVTTFLATTALSVSAAFAYGPAPQPGAAAGTQTIPAPVVVHTTSSSGVNVWAVVGIALGALVVGIALDELRRAISRHHHAHKLATA
jgi:hypothetical protein